MAVNLLEQARIAANNGEDKRAGIIMTFAEQSQLLAAIPTVSIMGDAKSWRKEASLGSVAARAVNEGYTESHGETELVAEPLKLYGGDLDVDNFIVSTGGPEARTTQEMMKAKAMARQIGYDLVKGSTTTAGGATANPKSINGLQARYGGGFGGTAVSTAGPTAGQLLANNGASDALSISRLDRAIMLVDNPTHLLMPKVLTVHMKTFLRSSASMSYTEDAFGRRIDTYNGIPILWADQNGDQASIAFDEGASSNRASIYVLSLGQDSLSLIQSGGGVRVADLGEQHSKPVWRTRVEWYIGLADMFPRAVARLHQIADIPAVA